MPKTPPGSFRYTKGQMAVIKRQFVIATNDLELGQSVQTYLESQTTEVHCATSVSDTLAQASKGACCLLTIDLRVSDMDKVEMIRIFRITNPMPILVLAEPMETDEKIALFRAGADSLIEKPINAEVCAAQANALVGLTLRYDEEKKFASITFGSSLVINPQCRQVLIAGEPVQLTRKEFDLLHFLAKRPGQVLNRDQLYDNVWGDSYDRASDGTVKAHIKTLRKKLSALGHDVIENVRGVGYRFVPPK